MKVGVFIFVSLVFKMSATEIVSVGTELISVVGSFADVCFMIILRLVDYTLITNLMH